LALAKVRLIWPSAPAAAAANQSLGFVHLTVKVNGASSLELTSPKE